MKCFAGCIGICHGLQRQGAGGHYKIELAAGNFFGNSVGGGHVTLGIVTFIKDVFPFNKAAFSQTVQHTLDTFVQDRLRRMLQNRYAEDMSCAGFSLIPIRNQQDA